MSIIEEIASQAIRSAGQAVDDLPPRTKPYTEEELDLLTDGVIKGIEDTAAWRDLVRKDGTKEARQIVRGGISARGPSALNEKPNPN